MNMAAMQPGSYKEIEPIPLNLSPPCQCPLHCTFQSIQHSFSRLQSTACPQHNFSVFERTWMAPSQQCPWSISHRWPGFHSCQGTCIHEVFHVNLWMHKDLVPQTYGLLQGCTATCLLWRGRSIGPRQNMRSLVCSAKAIRVSLICERYWWYLTHFHTSCYPNLFCRSFLLMPPWSCNLPIW